MYKDFLVELHIAGKSLTDLETILNLMSAPNVKQLCKEMKISSKVTLKSALVDALIKHTKQRCIFVKKKDDDDNDDNPIAKAVKSK